MNNLPRKILKYGTPREKFIKEFEQLELNQAC
jgi:IS30 family transposase